MSDNLKRRDKRSVVAQVRDSLTRRIHEDGLKPGMRLPTENELATEYAVARATVREALKQLEQDGLVDVRRGLGRFVSPTAGLVVRRPITTLESLTEMLQRLGMEARSRVVSAELTAPTDDEAAALDIEHDEKVIRLRRFYEHEGSVLIVSNNTVSAELLGDAKFTEVDFGGSFDRWMAERGHQPQSCAARIRAEPIPAELTGVPEIDANHVWLTITEQCVDSQGTSVLYSRDSYRGDIFIFNVLRRRRT